MVGSYSHFDQIYPAHLVLVHIAVRMKPTGDPATAELVALWRAVVKRYVD